MSFVNKDMVMCVPHSDLPMCVSLVYSASKLPTKLRAKSRVEQTISVTTDSVVKMYFPSVRLYLHCPDVCVQFMHSDYCHYHVNVF